MWDILYPKRCVLCDRILKQRESGICERCCTLPVMTGESFCLKCGKPVEEEEELCRVCKNRQFSFLAGRSAFVYDGYMRRSMKNFKYHGRQEYAEYYAKVLYQKYGGWVKQIQADALIPVPVHKRREKERGYNQSAVLAEKFSMLCNLPCYENILLRTKKTVPQKELSDKERFRNLCRAFCVNREVLELSKRINCVIIMDDIYTTGSTIEACTRALKTVGVEKVFFLCVCVGRGY